jgi:tetratricopeptide (TPR) repeat protein
MTTLWRFVASPRDAFRAATAAVALLASAAGACAQTGPQTALLEKSGWDALAAGQAHAAADAFHAALAGDPRNARLHLGAGAAAFLERREADARDELERALSLDPNLLDARALLGKVQHQLGDLAGAIRTYEALVDRSPRDQQIVDQLAQWRREIDLQDRMQQAVGAHFTVSFEGPAEAALADAALASLDRAYWRIGGLLGTYPTAPLSVVLYTTEQFRDITRSPSWAAGAFDGTIRVPMRGALRNQRELDRVLAHEFTHALVRSLAVRGIPTWLDEGLAAMLESDDISWAEQRLADTPARVPLHSLQNGFGRLSADEAQLAYATSALAVRRMVAEAGGVAVANLVRDLGDGVAFDTAFFNRIQRRFGDFEAGLF